MAIPCLLEPGLQRYTSYRGSVGPFFNCDTRSALLIMVVVNSAPTVTVASITDGLSNTMSLTESDRRLGLSRPHRPSAGPGLEGRAPAVESAFAGRRFGVSPQSPALCEWKLVNGGRRLLDGCF